MMKYKSCLSAALMAVSVLVGGSAVDAQQVRRDEQNSVRENTRRGTIRSLRQIESNVVPAMERRGAKYIGAEFEEKQLRYRLKFVRQSSVIWIDVDGPSGQIVAQTGN
jgi:ribosomal protein L25 (general stress protein Ctc)